MATHQRNPLTWRTLRRFAAVSLGVAICTSGNARQTPLAPTPPAAQRDSTGAALAPDQPLLADPRITDGRLENGLRYLVLRHANPLGGAITWLHVRSGSLFEQEGQRGVGHLIEHLAFEGSENFPPGGAVDLLSSLNLAYERHAFSSSGYERADYEFTLPDAKPETFDTALALLSDIAGRLNFPDASIDQERAVALDELRRGLSPDRRIDDATIGRLAPGSLLAARPVGGVEATLASLRRDDIVEFYARTYAPGAMTVIVVADADPAMVVSRITDAFAGLPGRPAPALPNPQISPSGPGGALVIAEPQVAEATVALARMAPARAPVTTVGRWRTQLVERLALRAFNRRVDERAALGRARFSDAEAMVGQIGRVAFRVQVTATSPVGSWRESLADLQAEVRRAVAEGFSAEELARARADALASATRSASTEAMRPGAHLARVLSSCAAAEEPCLSASQELDLGTRLLPGISDQEISRAFADLFGPAPTVVLTLPASASAVSEQDLLAASTGGAVAAPAPAAGTALVDRLPVEGEIAASSRHVGSSVLSLALPNHIPVHYRLMEHRHETVTVTVLLAGGEIEESASNRAVTRAAAEAWRSPATSSLTSEQIQKYLSTRQIEWTVSTTPDAVVLTMTAPPAQVETGLQLVHLMLTAPRLEEDVFERWKKRQLSAIEAMKAESAGVFAAALADTLYPPGEIRPRTPTAPQVQAVTLDAARAWLDRLARSAPAEVSIVGNLDEQRALKLVRRYFASLPERPDIAAASGKLRRDIPRPDSPRRARLTAPGAGPARILVGSFEPDPLSPRDRRLLDLAARLLDARAARLLRDEQKLAASIVVRSAPAEAYPHYGVFYAVATAEPAKSEALVAAVETLFQSFADSGPTPDEMKAMRKRVSADTTTELLEPAFWTDLLQDLDYRAGNLDDTMSNPEALLACTADEIREAFARCRKAGPPVQIVVTPAP